MYLIVLLILCIFVHAQMHLSKRFPIPITLKIKINIDIRIHMLLPENLTICIYCYSSSCKILEVLQVLLFIFIVGRSGLDDLMII